MNLASLKKSLKVGGIIAVLLMALTVTIIGGSRAANYFAKASSCQAQKVSHLQVTPNSAVISWETQDVSQGRVEYGTNPASLTFTAPEGTSGKTHNVPLTLLTPNTVYYYLVTIGNTRCDSSGQKCDSNCVPWSFTTNSPQVTPAQVTTLAPLPTSPPSTSSAIKESTPSSLLPTSSVLPTSSSSNLCTQVQAFIGKSSQDAATWNSVKQYDIDNNGVINGLDVVKCKQKGQ